MHLFLLFLVKQLQLLHIGEAKTNMINMSKYFTLVQTFFKLLGNKGHYSTSNPCTILHAICVKTSMNLKCPDYCYTSYNYRQTI